MHLQERAELFRLLGDSDRLRVLALCSLDELSVGELADLLKDSAPQLTRKTQPLRDAGLLLARKDGTRVLLKTAAVDDVVIVAALEEGRALCAADGTSARVPRVLLAREDVSRRYFESPTATPPTASPSTSALSFLPLLASLLPQRRLLVDVGAGDGMLLPLFAPLFDRVVAIDRSAVRLSQCADVVAAHGIANVRLVAGAADDAHVVEEVFRAGRADVVVVVRTLHHAARPQDLLESCARLLADNGTLLVLDYAAHDDETMRDHGDVWLGFSPEKLLTFAREVGLVQGRVHAMPAVPGMPDGHLHWNVLSARRITSGGTT
jgi:SAM-dependent methyltransferase